ncbi:MAG: hypothetical protein M3Y56_17035 [Armatimonadota bacterium]|nr:hypothetical protein [Armatimonadota bacterium]
MPHALVNTVRESPSDGAVPPQQPMVVLYLHEIIAAIIALIVVGVTAYFLLNVFADASKDFSKGSGNMTPAQLSLEKDRYERERDVLLYSLALMGTVTGYYLGRVPAEWRAQQSQQNANAAHSELKEAHQTVVNQAAEVAQGTQIQQQMKHHFIRDLADIKAALPPAQRGQFASSAEVDPSEITSVSPDITKARLKIDALVAKLEVE